MFCFLNLIFFFQTALSLHLSAFILMVNYYGYVLSENFCLQSLEPLKVH